MLLLNTLGILLLAFFNVWGSKGSRTAPLPNKQAGISSSVAHNNDTFMYRKCSGKSASIYCCMCMHSSQCVLLIVKRLIQILLIIGGVEQNPGPAPIRRRKSIRYREHAASTMVLYTSKCAFMRIEARSIHMHS